MTNDWPAGTEHLEYILMVELDPDLPGGTPIEELRRALHQLEADGTVVIADETDEWIIALKAYRRNVPHELTGRAVRAEFRRQGESLNDVRETLREARAKPHQPPLPEDAYVAGGRCIWCGWSLGTCWSKSRHRDPCCTKCEHRRLDDPRPMPDEPGMFGQRVR